jgi:hypothetical protein
MSDLKIALKQINFKWLPKHLNHIAENIIFKQRNVFFWQLMHCFDSRILF